CGAARRRRPGRPDSLRPTTNSLPPSLDRIADSLPNWRRRQVPIQPNPYGFPYQILLGHEPYALETAVPAVVAVVAHEKVLACRHDRFEVLRTAPRNEHDFVLDPAEELRADLGVRICVVLARPFIGPVHLQGNQRTVHEQLPPPHFDVIPGKPDETLDVVRRGLIRQAEDDDIAPLWLAERHDFGMHDGQPQPVREFVDEDEVPIEE